MDDIRDNDLENDLFGDELVPTRRFKGSDFLNLTEFPLAVLTRIVPENVKTLEFTDELYDKAQGKMVKCHLTIAGSDKFGLARAFDEDVLMALIQLTEQDGFKRRKVPYTRYQIIKLMGKSDYGDQYTKIEESIDRWGSITIISKNGWWRGEDKGLGDNTFHILNAKVDREADGTETRYFTWSEEMFEEIRAKRIRVLDMEIYRQLNHPLAKRLYRWLDKTFSYMNVIERDVNRMLCDKFGMWRGKDIGTLKRRLEPAILELEQAGVIKKTAYKKRFTKERKKEWYIKLEKNNTKNSAPELTVEDEAICETHHKMRKLGVNEKVIIRILSENPKEFLDHQLEIMDAILSKKNNGIEEPAAFFVSRMLVKDDDIKGIDPPVGFRGQAELELEEQSAAAAKVKREVEDFPIMVDSVAEVLRSDLQKEESRMAAKLAANMDASIESELINYINSNKSEDCSTCEKYDLRSEVIPSITGEIPLTAFQLSCLRKDFFKLKFPDQFTKIDLNLLAKERSSFSYQKFGSTIIISNPKPVIDAAIAQIQSKG